MTKGKRLKTYQISGRIQVDVDISVKAASLEEALKQSNDMDIHDFIEMKGDFIDGKLQEITGIFKLNN